MLVFFSDYILSHILCLLIYNIVSLFLRNPTTIFLYCLSVCFNIFFDLRIELWIWQKLFLGGGERFSCIYVGFLLMFSVFLDFFFFLFFFYCNLLYGSWSKMCLFVCLFYCFYFLKSSGFTFTINMRFF